MTQEERAYAFAGQIVVCLLLLLSLSGCHSVFVWTAGDAFGLVVFGLIAIIIGGLFLCAAICDGVRWIKRKLDL